MVKIVMLGIIVLLVIVFFLMSNWRFRSAVGSKLSKMPAAENDIQVQQGVRITTPDGIVLGADLYRPKGDGRYPTIVTRTPYGRRFAAKGEAEYFARRGYNVLLQDVRGAGDSTGTFTPLSNEKRDGAATVEWVKTQPWFNGDIAIYGISYVGYTANAIAVQNDPSVKVLFSAISPRGFRDLIYTGGGLNLDTSLMWTSMVNELKKADYKMTLSLQLKMIPVMVQGMEGLKVPYDHLPFANADSEQNGTPIRNFQTFVQSADPDAPYWRDSSLTEEEVAGIQVPVCLATSWHDIVLPDVLRNYETLSSMGKQPIISIGVGAHGNDKEQKRYRRLAKAWFDHHLKNMPLPIGDKRVQFNIIGTDEWIETESWPVRAKPLRFYLDSEGGLGPSAPSADQSYSSYRYDPMEPTPAIGGLLFGSSKLVVDNAKLEARDDTIFFTSRPFEEDTLVVGEINASIHFGSDVETSDLFIRANRVLTNGKSENFTDVVKRYFFDEADDGAVKATLAMPATAIRFKKGERLRIVIASGAHPRIARNFGTGTTQEQASMVAGKSANIKVFHSAMMPSFIDLPIAEEARLYLTKRH